MSYDGTLSSLEVRGAVVPATHYHPELRFTLPTLRQIVDVPAHSVVEGGFLEEYPAQWHYECAQCGERVRPGSCADTHEWHIPGLKRYYVDDERVTKDEFERRAREAGLTP